MERDENATRTTWPLVVDWASKYQESPHLTTEPEPSLLTTTKRIFLFSFRLFFFFRGGRRGGEVEVGGMSSNPTAEQLFHFFLFSFFNPIVIKSCGFIHGCFFFLFLFCFVVVVVGKLLGYAHFRLPLKELKRFLGDDYASTFNVITIEI